MASQHEIDQLAELNTLLKTFDLDDRVYIFRIGGGVFFYCGADDNMLMCQNIDDLREAVHATINQH